MNNWNDIVREHGPPTYRAAWRVLQHPEDCEDVVQEVFIEAHSLFVFSRVEKPNLYKTRNSACNPIAAR